MDVCDVPAASMLGMGLFDHPALMKMGSQTSSHLATDATLKSSGATVCAAGCRIG